MSKKKESQEENEEVLVEQVYAYLTHSQYPAACDKNQKRVIRKKATRFVVRDGELYYKLLKKNKVVGTVRYIQSKSERRKILNACHVDPTSGHLGVTKTIYRLRERFMWQGYVKDIEQMVATCDVCQHINRKMTTGAPELHPIPVKSPWYHVGIDFIGPISPTSDDGNRYILTLSDYCTKWMEAIPTPDKSASSVATALFKIFMRMGLPRVVTSDQGREFNNSLDNANQGEVTVPCSQLRTQCYFVPGKTLTWLHLTRSR